MAYHEVLSRSLSQCVLAVSCGNLKLPCSAALKPIIVKVFFSRLQVGLKNNHAITYFRLTSSICGNLSHNNKEWILHAIDHWSNFNFAYAIESKHAVNVADALKAHIFPSFGVQSDNGCEFINQVLMMENVYTKHALLNATTLIQVIKQLLQRWSHDIQLVSGRPRHPQSQCAVERAHYTFEKTLTVKIHQDR